MHEVAVAALPARHRVAVDGVHVDVDGEQVVAALGAVADHRSRGSTAPSGACPAGAPACRSGPAGRCRCRLPRSRPSARRGSWPRDRTLPRERPWRIMVAPAHQCPSSPPSSPVCEPELGPLEGEPQPLDGGITNRNYRVRMGGEDLVLRLCDHGAEVLGIDRTTEEIASRRAAAERASRRAVVAFLPDVPRARHALAARRRRPRRAACARRACWRRSPPMLRAPPRRPRRCRARSRSSGSSSSSARSPAALPDSYERRSLACCTGSRRRAAAAPSTTPSPATTTCSTANFVRDGARRADRRLGVRGDERPLLRPRQPVGQQRLRRRATTARCSSCTSTSRRPTARFAALQLMRIVSDFREAMWGACSCAAPTLDFDYAAYADEHFERLERAAADPRVEEWLARCRDRVSCPSARASSSSAAGWAGRRSPTTSRSSASATSCSSTAPS